MPVAEISDPQSLSGENLKMENTKSPRALHKNKRTGALDNEFTKFGSGACTKRNPNE